MAASATQGRASSAFPVSPIPVHELPLIDCPEHPGRKLVLFTANTEKNPGRNFFRCMRNARRADACDRFFWENEYYEYLVNNGFLDDFDLGGRHGVAQGLGTAERRHGVLQGFEELQRRVGHIENEIGELKRRTDGSTRQQAGDLVFVVVCVNVTVVVVALIISMLKK